MALPDSNGEGTISVFEIASLVGEFLAENWEGAASMYDAMDKREKKAREIMRIQELWDTNCVYFLQDLRKRKVIQNQVEQIVQAQDEEDRQEEAERMAQEKSLNDGETSLGNKIFHVVD